jgi:lipopolysaccharide biosynthesis glycosyltransferase
LYNTDEDFNNDETFSALELKEAMENPIQLHYAGYKKPWKEDCTKAEEWFSYVMKTPFSGQFRFKSPSSRHVIESQSAEDSLETNASTQTNGSSTQRGAQTAGKAENILAKIRQWIQARGRHI